MNVKWTCVCLVVTFVAVLGDELDNLFRDEVALLYTKSNPQNGILLKTNTMKSAPSNASNPTVVLFHGQTETGKSQWIRQARDTFFIRGEYNVIVSDCYKYTRDIFFGKSHIKKCGEYMGQLLSAMIQQKKINGTSLHLIGSNSGAHSAAHAAKKLKKSSKDVVVGRITGLDPSQAQYTSSDQSSERLSHADASFVDVIHTSAFGMQQSIGHADFYPNGGSQQPGCMILFIPNQMCNMERAEQLFIESIYSDEFVAQKCSSWNAYNEDSSPCLENDVKAKMGMNCKNTTRGNFFLSTNAESPYALGGDFEEETESSTAAGGENATGTKTDDSSTAAPTGESSTAAATGDSSTAAATGDSSTAAPTGS